MIGIPSATRIRVNIKGEDAECATAMFGMLSVFGDIGCSVGPWVSGIISDAVQKSYKLISMSNYINISANQLGIKLGILSGAIAPTVLLICTLLMIKHNKISSKA